MMSKKQWFAVLCMYVVYLMLGCFIFLDIEQRAELKWVLEDKKQKLVIEGLLNKHYTPDDGQDPIEIFDKLETYCGKPLNPNMTEEEYTLRWDFYHAVFFVLTVVTTVGYGNLAPTQPSDRIFMMFYAVIGMPLNGLVIITLGDYFGKSFTKLYDRWKTQRVQHTLATLGLVGQIVLYLIPGITFFIILPSIIIKIFEGWPYDVAVFYSFVTLTTIGFGDYVAGMKENGHGTTIYIIYKIFLLIWIISGLAYIVMVFGFVTRGIHSKKMRALEHKIAQNIKKTNYRIREEFRAVLNEYLLMKVKRVYREKFVYVPTKPGRSQSCPDLTIYRNMQSPTMTRKRAFSAVENITPPEISRVQSDSDLERIDKDKTFNPTSAMVQPSKLLMRVVNALGNYGSPESNNPPIMNGINLFSEEEILASERPSSGFSIGSHKITAVPIPGSRRRAASECRIPYTEKISVNNDLTWYGPAATKRLQEIREQAKYEKSRNKSVPQLNRDGTPRALFNKLKNTFSSSKDDNRGKNLDIEQQEYFSSNISYSANPSVDDPVCNIRQARRDSSMYSIAENEQVLEETSIADFLRALTAISVPDISNMCDMPKRKLGTAGLTPPESTTPTRLRREQAGLPSFYKGRRTSLMPISAPENNKYRRFSLRPEMTLMEPPPYYQLSDATTSVPKRTIAQNRKFSLRPVANSGTSSPVQRHALRFKQALPQALRSRFSRDDSSA